jgi:hypothetical protein
MGTVAILGGALVLGGMSAAQATPTVSSSTSISFGNNTETATYAYYTNYVDSDQSSTGAPVTSSFSGNISGLNSSGNSQTMGVNGTAKASAQYGQLKTSSDLSLTTPFQNWANAPYVGDDAHNNTIDTNGIPDWFEAKAMTRLQDTLSLAAESTVSSLHLTFHLDGSIANNGLSANTMRTEIDVFGNTTSANCYGLSNCYFTQTAAGTVDTSFDVILDVTNPSAIDLALSMASISQAHLDATSGYLETGDYALNVDFYNTLELTDITAFDANSNPVTLTGLTGASGTNYLALVSSPTPPSNNGVPEPATLALFGTALAGLSLGKRRAKARRG